MDIDFLNFLVKLYECRDHRVYLANWKNFTEKDKICEYLGARGLIDFTRQIATVKITEAGQALLKLKTVDLPISKLELRVLQKIGKSVEIVPSKIIVTIKGKSLKAKERSSIIDGFCDRGLISLTTKKAKDKCEVWLTEKGLDCIKQVNDYFLSWQSSLTQETQKPTDEAILQTITELDAELGTNNYLPIFQLRKALQPLLSRKELDRALYRLQEQDKLEMNILTECDRYSTDETKAGIPLATGESLFYIVVY